MKIHGCTVAFVASNRVWFLSSTHEMFVVEINYIKRMYPDNLKENNLVWLLYHEKLKQVQMVFNYAQNSEQELREMYERNLPLLSEDESSSSM